MSAPTATRRETEAAIVAKAQSDDAFRQALLKDPKAVIERELGISLPPGLELKVVEESAALHYLVLPPAMNRELSDAELGSVSGGRGAIPENMKHVIGNMRG